jgi:ABC-type nitrate/sulfonate/bicarbonate transport system substrate-binding protein
MSLSSSDQRALTLLIGFGVAMGLYLLAIEPLYLRYKTVQDGIDSANDTIQKTNMDRRKSDMRRVKLQERKQEVNQYLTLYGGRTPTLQRLSISLSDIQHAAGQSGVKLGEVRPLESKAVDGRGMFDEQLYQLEFTGSYAQTAAMLYLLETGRGLVKILQCDFSTREGSELSARVLARRSFLHEPELDTTAVGAKSTGAMLRAGLERRPALGGLYVAERNGFLADPQAGVSLIQSDQALDFFRRGDLEAVVVSPVEFLLLGAEGHPVTAVAVLSKGAGGAGLVSRDVALKSAADLKGRTVAVQENGATHLMLASLLAKAGLKLSDVRIQDMTPQQAVETLINGDIDLALLAPPFLTRVTESGKFNVLPVPADLWSGRHELLIVRNDALKSKPDAVRHLAEAAFNGNAWWKGNAVLGNGMVAQTLWCSSEEVSSNSKSIVLLSPEENVKLLQAGEGELRKELLAARKFLQEDCGIDVPENLLEGVSDSVVKALLAAPAPATGPVKEAAP